MSVQAQAVYKPRVEGWARDACHRNHEERVQLLPAKAGPAESAIDGLRASSWRHTQSSIVRLAEGGELRITLHREGQVPVLDPNVRE